MGMNMDETAPPRRPWELCGSVQADLSGLCGGDETAPQIPGRRFVAAQINKGLQQNLWVNAGFEYASARSPRRGGSRVAITEGGKHSVR